MGGMAKIEVTNTLDMTKPYTDKIKRGDRQK